MSKSEQVQIKNPSLKEALDNLTDIQEKLNQIIKVGQVTGDMEQFIVTLAFREDGPEGEGMRVQGGAACNPLMVAEVAESLMNKLPWKIRRTLMMKLMLEDVQRMASDSFEGEEGEEQEEKSECDDPDCACNNISDPDSVFVDQESDSKH